MLPVDTAHIMPIRAIRSAVVLVFLAASLLTATQPLRAQSTVKAVTSNSQWDVQIDTFDDVEMALVPPGCFPMGSVDGDSESPITKICFDQPFYIDVLEVSNDQFNTKNGTAKRTSWFPAAELPRQFITWFEAGAFCKARGGRLPTEAEWEYAARGPDGLRYTWGNELANNALVLSNRPARGGTFPEGASWVGAQDMLGNVWEWTSSLYKRYPYKATDGRESTKDTRSSRSIRGGGFGDILFTTATFRAYATPLSVGADVGFRCAKDYSEP